MTQPIGSIGAIPVFGAMQDATRSRLWMGATVAVSRGGDAYEFFQVQPATVEQDGLGFALPATVAAGSAGGPVGVLVGIGVSLIPLIGKLFGGGPSQQDRDAGSQFEQLCARVTAIFNQIQLTPGHVITAADAQQAQAEYAQLADVANQLQSVAYVRDKWNSAAYKPAYEQRLGQIIQAASQTAATGAGGSPTTTTGGGSTTTTQGTGDAAAATVGGIPTMWILLAVILLFALRR